MSSGSQGGQVLPFYIVCDESMSMSDHIDGVNKSLVDLHVKIAEHPTVCDKTRVSIITFSDTADVLVPLTQLDLLNSVPGCQAKGATSYGAAFRKLRSTIDTDLAMLKSQGSVTLRPVVFFITDGEPTDDDGTWRSAHADLVAPTNPYFPHILSFGVDQADAAVLLDIATPVDRLGNRKFAYLAEDGTEPGPALREIIGKLSQSIVNSASNGDKPRLMPPTDIEGVRLIDGFDIDVV